VTVSVLASLNEADVGSIHSGGVLLSKQAKTIPKVFKLCVSVTVVMFVKACRKFAPLEPVPWTCVHVLTAAQRNKLAPGLALELKKTSPTAHVEGSAVPVLAGLVVAAPLASQLPNNVRLPLMICCAAQGNVMLNNAISSLTSFIEEYISRFEP
jgi:hypothetical protein